MLFRSLLLAPPSGKPRVIICHTVKGRGVSFIERNLHWHHKGKLTDAEIVNIFDELEI